MSGICISVIGGGSWGTALVHLLLAKGHRVRFWVLENHTAQQINQKQENSTYLPGVSLQGSLHVSTSIEEVLLDTDLILFSVPSQFSRGVLTQMLPFLSHPVPVVSATKGVETDSLCLMTDLMKQILPKGFHQKLAVLSGPSFAQEVARGLPTAVTLASEDLEVAKKIQPIFSTSYFRVYISSDPLGVQVGGALKNVMAIAAGVTDGLALGSNSRAALITRGLREITRLGIAMGGQQETFYGLSGVGDLVLTCTGDLSRNRQVGIRLGQGSSLETILKEMHMVAEGVQTTQAVYRLAERYKVRMPIVSQVHALLFEGEDPHKALSNLMGGSAGIEVGGE